MATSWKELRAERAQEPGFDDAYRRARLEVGGVDPKLSTMRRVFEQLGAEFIIGADSVRVA